MKKQLILLFFFLLTSLGFTQNNNYKEYSYTEFLQLIQNEKDSVFKLEDALIKYNPKTDLRFKRRISSKNDSIYNRNKEIVIDKKIVLNKVHFLVNVFNADGAGWMEGVLRDVHFKKDVELDQVISFNAEHCKFSGDFDYSLVECDSDQFNTLRTTYNSYRYCSFQKFSVFKNCERSTSGARGFFLLRNNTFNSNEDMTTFSAGIYGSESAQISDNYIQSKGLVYFFFNQISGGVQYQNNTIKSEYTTFYLDDVSGSNFNENQFSSFVRLSLDELNSDDDVEWQQFKGKLLSVSSHADFVNDVTNGLFGQINLITREKLHKKYIDSVRYHNKSAFVGEIALKGRFYDYYKSRYDTETANEVYLELKDFETDRMKIRYQQNPTFKTYFTWKTNQFLKVFSAYGTQPARAIIFSLYVIVFFALIYLFFPNSWDSHGKNRIMDRYRFFLKYVNKNAGIHEVYLDEKKPELLDAEDFKTYLLQQGKTAPKFFTSTALPLYRWSIAGTKTFSWLLSKIDILKGTWSETSPSKQKWKSVLIFFAFFFAIVYDLFIKILNALMLSINTFTTLGFGEIPIKGLPRYLAIIQGFIGWFMLTIFSVSLISQLLN